MAEYQNQMIVGWKKYDRILVKANVDSAVWQVALFDSYNEDNLDYPYRTTDNRNFAFALPYEGNEELIGTVYSSLEEKHKSETLGPKNFGDNISVLFDNIWWRGIYLMKSPYKGRHLVLIEPALIERMELSAYNAIRSIPEKNLKD